MYNFNHLTSDDLKQKLRLRSDVLFSIRSYFHKNGFTEISTPILSFPTKEYGEGEFVALSKLQPGKFYSLPHSPQLYKQFLIATMGDKINKYYQIAYNFRPETGDDTHVQEFQQIDFEIARASVEDIKQVIRDVLEIALSAIEAQVSFTEIDYDECLQRFGIDSPDLRYEGAEIGDGKEGKINFSIPREDIAKEKQLQELFPSHSYAKIKKERSHDVLVFSANSRKDAGLLGTFRNKLIQEDIVKHHKEWSLVWLTNLPLFQKGLDGKLKTLHHPQMISADESLSTLDGMNIPQLLELKGAGCDLIMNGIEVAGGNVRNHDHEIQKQILKLTGSTDRDLAITYKPLLSLLKRFPEYRSGGAAIGLDRLIMLLTHSRTLHEVQPFPMNRGGLEFMGGPWPLSEDDVKATGLGKSNN